MMNNSDILKKILIIIKQGHVEMYLIKRTSSIKIEKMKEVLKVDIEKEVRKFFIEALNLKIEELEEINDEKYKNIFSKNIMPDDILSIEDISLIPILPHVITNINKITDLEPVKEFDDKTIMNLQSYAIEFSLKENQRVIYFRKYGKGAKLSSSIPMLIFRKGTFDKLDGDIFKVDRNIDCIYFQFNDFEKLYIINEKNFEEIFSFIELYQQETKDVQKTLDEYEYINIKDKLFDKILNQKRIIKQITYLSKNKQFDNIDFNRIKQVHKKAKKLRFKIIGTQVIINDKNALKDFLDVCEQNILQDPVDIEQLFRTKYKQAIK